MSETQRCFFNILRVSLKEEKERNSESAVSAECCDNFTSLYELFENPSNFNEKSIAEIILARGAAEFEAKRDEYQNVFICNHHYDELYRKWNKQSGKHIILRKQNRDESKKSVCSFPEGGGINHGSSRPFTTGCIATFDEAKQYLNKEKQLIHVGLPICQEHKKFLQSLNTIKLNQNSELQSSSSTATAESESCEYRPREARKSLQKPEQTVTDTVAEAVRNLAKAAGITNISSNEFYSELAEDTKRKKADILKKITHLVAEYMAPDEPESLMQKISNNSRTDSKISKQVDKLLTQVEQQYYVAVNDRERNEVLSQVANSFPLSTLLNYFPFLTRNRYSRARQTAELRKTKWNIAPTPKIRVRYNKEFINLFIEFLTSPLVMVGLPFGTQKLKSSTGEVIEIPNTIRKHRANELCLMFDRLMAETGREDVKISKSKKLEIIKICKASRRIATQCVDYYVAEGNEAFETLYSLLDDLLKLDLIDEPWKKEVKYLLQQAQHYLKTDYRIHIKLFSRCADHCITFALSDPNNSKFSSPKCSNVKEHEHEHDMQCEQCLYFPEAIRKIQNILNEFSTNSETNENVPKMLEFGEIVEQCKFKIENLKMHILRSSFSEMERIHIIRNLKNGEAFIIMDYAQKFIPRKSDQPQRDYYAQKGLSWHICYIYVMINNVLMQHSTTHLMGFEKQSAKTVITITRDLLQKLKSWNVNVITFRSDNASNYRNIELMINLFAMSVQFGIRIKRYSFSEVQDGKGLADTECSILKRLLRDFLDAGYNVETPAAMYEAFQYGTRPLYGKTVVIASVSGKDCDVKKPLTGISKLSDFIFDYEKKQIRYWQHFGIGKGETINFEDYKGLVLNAELTISIQTPNTPETENFIFWKSINGTTNETLNNNEELEEETEIDPEDESILGNPVSIFFCPVNGCQKKFQKFGNLQRHVTMGNHALVPERCTLKDYALKTYKQSIEGASTTTSLPELPELLENLAESGEVLLQKGWAIRQRAPRIIYTADMKAFLNVEFQTAQNKNQRINPKSIQEKMAAIKKDGKLRFKVSERLSSLQIGRYFAAKLNALRNEEHNSTEENCDDEIFHDEPMFNDIFETLCEEMDWSKLIPPGKEEGEWDESDEEEEISITPLAKTPQKKTPKKKTPQSSNKRKNKEDEEQNENEPPEIQLTPRRKSQRLSGSTSSSTTPKPFSSSKRPRVDSKSPGESEFSKSKKRRS